VTVALSAGLCGGLAALRSGAFTLAQPANNIALKSPKHAER